MATVSNSESLTVCVPVPTEPEQPELPKNLIDSIWSNFGSNTKEIYQDEVEENEPMMHMEEEEKDEQRDEEAIIPKAILSESAWFNVVKAEEATLNASFSCFNVQTLKSEQINISEISPSPLPSPPLTIHDDNDEQKKEEDELLNNISEPSLSCSDNEMDAVQVHEDEDEDDYEPFLSPKALRDLDVAQTQFDDDDDDCDDMPQIFEVYDEPEPLVIDGPKEDAKCWAFNSAQGCKAGKSCRWLHEPFETGRGTGHNICWAFDSKYGCKKGIRCKWVHRRHPNVHRRATDAYR